MKVEVEVISKEIIKPSSPTPDHLRRYQLSFLDQISVPAYNPFVMFYSSEELDPKLNAIEVSHKLKKSISDVLTKFYPLAGRLHENQFIDCNDEGIPYSEARVKCRLSNFLHDPVPAELYKFIPFEPDMVPDVALGVQLNIFECGGIAIASCISHKIADGLSTFMFLKSWAATARGEYDEAQGPQFVSSTLFPPKHMPVSKARLTMTKKNVASKRFVFDAKAIEALKAKYMDTNTSLGEEEIIPSRVEALSAFIWSRFMATIRVDDHDQRSYTLVHAVNLRTRIDPTLPEYSFGNLYRVAMTFPSLVKAGEENCGLVRQIREQISQIDKDYVKKIQDGIQHLDFIKEEAEKFFKGEMVTLSFTSWCRFPLYESDFGWGKPTWIAPPPLTFKNLVVFVDNKTGDGIEAFINLEEQVMAKFESDKEFLAFISSTK